MADEPFVMKMDISEESLKSLGLEKVKRVPVYDKKEITSIMPMAEPVGKKYLELYSRVEQ